MSSAAHPGSRFDISDRRVLITGGGSGLGAAVAGSFADQGARVVAMDSSFSEISDIGALRRVPGDVREPSFADLVRSEADLLGGLDVVFANAGVSLGSAYAEPLDGDDW